MISFFNRVFSNKPANSSEEDQWRFNFFKIINIFLIVVLSAMLIARRFTEDIFDVIDLTYILVIVFYVIMLFQHSYKKLWLNSFLVTFVSWSFITFFVVIGDGIYDAGLYAYFAIVVVSSFLLSWHLVAFFFIISIAAIWMFVYHNVNGEIIIFEPGNAIRFGRDITATFLIVTGLVGFYFKRITEMYRRLNKELYKRIQTEKKLSESKDELVRKNKEYERINQELINSNLRIREINNQLQKAKDQAEESVILKSAFLANISHEIRTPMNSILGFSELALKEEVTKEKREKYLGFVMNNGKQLLTIVNDILDVSKLETNQMEIVPVNADIVCLIEEVIYAFEAKVKDKNLKLIKDYPALQQHYLYVDPFRLKQILYNLINNALKFTSSGSIAIGFSLHSNYVKFYVEDTGIGIPKDLHEKVFERFRQAESSKTRKYGGTGLGLSICKSLVEIMGGQIGVESVENKGTNFWFTIPN